MMAIIENVDITENQTRAVRLLRHDDNKEYENDPSGRTAYTVVECMHPDDLTSAADIWIPLYQRGDRYVARPL
jgi:hypothetical protein